MNAENTLNDSQRSRSRPAARGSASVRKTEVLWTDGRIVGGVTVNNTNDLKAALCRAVDEGWRYIEAKTPNSDSTTAGRITH